MHRILKLALALTLTFSAGALVLAATPSAASAQTAPKKKKAKAKAKAKAKKKHKKAKAKHKAKAHAHRVKAGERVDGALKRTHRGIVVVGKAVRESGQGKRHFAKAVAHQRAARKALGNARPGLAMHLTLGARKHLKKAAAAAGMEAPADLEPTGDETEALDEAEITPEETEEAGGMADEAEGELPDDDVLLQEESFGDAE